MKESKCVESISTSEALSRDDSLSSLPETESAAECEWPDTDNEWLEPACTSLRRSSRPGALSPPLLPAGPPGQFTPPEDFAPPAQQTSFFRVAYEGGVEVRAGPFNSPQTGLVLPHNEILAVSEEVVGTDGLVYLCLADGHGWVFDDTALMPHDPSVVRCASPPSCPPPPYSPSGPGPETVLPPPPTMPTSPMLPPPLGEILSSTPVGTAPVIAQVMVGPPVPAQRPPPTDQIFMQPAVAWYRVTALGGLSLRTAPSFNSQLTGGILACNETFPVAEEVPYPDGRVYLYLCDGRGWVFDDTALMPHDPSVKRGTWMSHHSAGWNVVYQSSSQIETPEDGNPIRRRRMYPQPRGKRGGKRCSKRKQNAAAVAGAGTGIAPAMALQIAGMANATVAGPASVIEPASGTGVDKTGRTIKG